jgi:two-component system chemotaxis response regulator CheY
MKSLVVDDDFSNRLLLQRFLSELGEVHIAVNGHEAVEAVRAALDEKAPYQLICLDIMMPGLDGQQALQLIRELEQKHQVPAAQRAKVAMTTALSDKESVLGAFREQADAYLIKPVLKARLFETVLRWGLT